MTVEREPVVSNVLRSVGHDRASSTLEVEFTDGDVYRYFAVPTSVHQRLMDAASKGGFFTAYVRDVYPYEQI